ncbi:6-bladed beta-propeller [Gemmatimonadota bacterium]
MNACKTCLLPLITCLLISCTSQAGDPRHRFAVETVDGVATVVNNAVPKYSDELFEYEEVFRFREDPENEESILFRPREIVQDDRGYFYILDSGNTRIAVFDDNGVFARSIGREGEGPGDFRRPGTPIIHDGHLQIYDLGLRRLSIFTTDGEFVEVISLNQMMGDHGIRMPMLVFRCEDGSLIINEDSVTSEEEKQLSIERVFCFEPDGSLRWQTETPQAQIGAWVMFQGVRGLGARMPFASRPAVSLDPVHGILVSPANEPVLLLYDLDGTLKRRIELQLEEMPFTATDRSVITDDWDERIRNASGPSVEQLQSMRDGLPFPERWPYWGSVAIDDAGYLWLKVSERALDYEVAGSGVLCRIISPAGEYIGNTRLPQGSGPTSHGCRIARLSDPDTDETIFVLYRVRSAVEGFTYP